MKYNLTCVYCGKKYVSQRPDSFYCSSQCSHKRQQQHKKELAKLAFLRMRAVLAE